MCTTMGLRHSKLLSRVVLETIVPGRSLLLACAVCVLMTAGACGGGGTAPAVGARTASGPAAAGTTRSDRCEAVPRALVDTIASRLTGRETLRDARAVKSGDFGRVWFVSAEIDGPGLDGDGEVGTWAKTGPLAVGTGRILSVDTVFAQQLSGWDAGDTTYADVTMADDGAEASRRCVDHG
jgi:hypothetical protein